MKTRIWIAVILGVLFIVNAMSITAYKESPNSVVPVFLTEFIHWSVLFFELWVTLLITFDFCSDYSTWVKSDGHKKFAFRLLSLIGMFASVLIFQLFVNKELKHTIGIWGSLGCIIGTILGVFLFFLFNRLTNYANRHETEMYD